MAWQISRRKFLINSALFTGAALLAPKFAVSNHKKKGIKFGVLTDSHYADAEPSGTRFYRQSTEKMKACVEVLNQEKVDFAIHLGDLKDQDSEHQTADTIQYLKDIEAAFAEFNGPRYHCIGNHDMDSISKQQFLDHIENTGIKTGKGHYSYDMNGFHFIVLDPNFHADGRSHNNGDFEWYDANLPEWQWSWFEEDLKKTKLPTVVFCHFALFELVKGESVFHITDYPRAQKIMKDSGKVIAVFQGHVHEENFEQIEGIHYVTQLGMVDYSGLENNSFAIVEITADELIINGYKRAGNQRLLLNT